MKDRNGNHILYKKNQLVGACVELRFPPIPEIVSEPPAQFQDTIRDDYPNYQFNILHMGGNGMLQPNGDGNSVQLPTHIFATKDNVHFISVSPPSFSLSCTTQYPGWDATMKMIDKPLYNFIQTYSPKSFTRVGIRYLNAISRQDLGLEGHAWRELIHPMYLGVLIDEAIPEDEIEKSVVEMNRDFGDGFKACISAGPGYLNEFRGNVCVQEKTKKFIVDVDVSYREPIGTNELIPTMTKAHEYADKLFSDAITSVLRDAMQPVIAR